MTIGDRIRQKRLENGMTQEELAKLVGYADKSGINKIEKNARDFPMTKLDIFAKALGVSSAELLGEAAAPVRPTFSYCLEQQMHTMDYDVLYDAEGNVILNHDGALVEITDMDVKELEVRVASYIRFLCSELEERRRKK